MPDQTYEQWIKQVDKILEAKVGLDHRCMRDRNYWDAWNDGQDPEEFVLDEWGDDPNEMMREELFG